MLEWRLGTKSFGVFLCRSQNGKLVPVNFIFRCADHFLLSLFPFIGYFLSCLIILSISCQIPSFRIHNFSSNGHSSHRTWAIIWPSKLRLIQKIAHFRRVILDSDKSGLNCIRNCKEKIENFAAMWHRRRSISGMMTLLNTTHFRSATRQVLEWHNQGEYSTCIHITVERFWITCVLNISAWNFNWIPL